MIRLGLKQQRFCEQVRITQSGIPTRTKTRTDYALCRRGDFSKRQTSLAHIKAVRLRILRIIPNNGRRKKSKKQSLYILQPEPQITDIFGWYVGLSRDQHGTSSFSLSPYLSADGYDGTVNTKI
jgi:hypothetical protein